VQGSRKSIRTLVVDDSPVALGSIRCLLKNRRSLEIVGYAEDGEEGVARARDLQPDLILMDLQMPRLDGMGAIRLIRRFSDEVRIIVITFLHGDEVRKECREIGADGFVVKDRLYQDLIAEIQRVFTGHSIGLNGHVRVQ
jgi:two-component system, NarL family, response regulator